MQTIWASLFVADVVFRAEIVDGEVQVQFYSDNEMWICDSIAAIYCHFLGIFIDLLVLIGFYWSYKFSRTCKFIRHKLNWSYW